jgi:HD superfamily phosphohydrolase
MPTTIGNMVRDSDPNVPEIGEFDRRSVRLGALLHDIGHGPLSHVSENLIQGRFSNEFVAVERILSDHFEGVSHVAASEMIAVLFVLSEPMRRIFEDPNFGAPPPATKLAPAVAARILGSRSYLNAMYLSGVVSGPLDADKLDYMARDSHHAGLPLALDIDRLISKLDVVIITPTNAPKRELRERALGAPNQRVYEMGISRAGLSAYEHLIVGRVMLYDRLYYHHKTRAAESIARELIEQAENEIGRSLCFAELFTSLSDDAFLAVLGGLLRCDEVPSGSRQASALAKSLLYRDLYHRSFAFAPRFIAGMEKFSEQERNDTRALIWNSVLTDLGKPTGCADLAREIVSVACSIADHIPEFEQCATGLQAKDVIVDLPMNKAVVRGSDILTRTESGFIEPPNLYFDPEKWSQAYANQKHGGFVFTRKDYIPLIALASRLKFFEKFGVVFDTTADSAAKTVGIVLPEWIRRLGNVGLCSRECVESLGYERIQLARVRPEDLNLPPEWLRVDADVGNRLARELNDLLVSGLPASVIAGVTCAISELAIFLNVAAAADWFANLDSLHERALQEKLRDHLRSREVKVVEGSEIGGGETDLVLPGDIVVENKVNREAGTIGLAKPICLAAEAVCDRDCPEHQYARNRL